MLNKKVAIVTGASKMRPNIINNAIGRALSDRYDIITIDKHSGDIQIEISRENQFELLNAINDKLKGRPVWLLVNANAILTCDEKHPPHNKLFPNHSFPYLIMYDILMNNGLFVKAGFKPIHSVINIRSAFADAIQKTTHNDTMVKAVINGFTYKLAAEGVRCNTVSIGPVLMRTTSQKLTDEEIKMLYLQIKTCPLDRTLMPEDVGDVVAMIDACKAISGQNIRADYGQHVSNNNLHR